MYRCWAVLVSLAAVGCGRIGFDVLAPGDGAGGGDGSTADAPAGSFAYVQGNGIQGTSVTSLATYQSAQTAGDLNVVVIDFEVTASVVSVSDTNGNTYMLVPGVIGEPSTGQQAMYYAENVAAAAAGANEVMVNFTISNSNELRIVEYAGVATSAALDMGTTGASMGTAIDWGPLTTTGAPELLLAADVVQYVTSMAGAGYTSRLVVLGDMIEDQVAPAAGIYHATATQNTAGGWVMELAAFRGR